MLRSLLFVPGDRPERFAKAVASGADAIILDLEDSVAPDAKPAARAAIRAYLDEPRTATAFVRVNPLDGGLTASDLETILPGKPDAIMLPKAEGSTSVETLLGMMGGAKVPVLPIATETPAAIFELGSYAGCRDALVGLTWGAEDLPAAIGATAAREADGSYTSPLELARALTLFGAHKAQIQAIETVYPAISDLDGLARYANRGRRDGFTGMMAIHPSQVAVINQAFMPSADEVAYAEEVLAAFAAAPGAGVIQLRGKMLDLPHRKQAEAVVRKAAYFQK